MAIRNPMANFNFKLSLDGIDNIACQLVTEPSTEWTEHKGGSEGNSPDVKTPGKRLIGDLVVETQVPDTGDSSTTWKRFEDVKTMNRAIYCGDGFFYETDPNGSPVTTYKIVSAWLKKVESSNSERKGDASADKMRTLTFSVEDYILQ